jgi:hypothetical protein
LASLNNLPFLKRVADTSVRPLPSHAWLPKLPHFTWSGNDQGNKVSTQQELIPSLSAFLRVSSSFRSSGCLGMDLAPGFWPVICNLQTY